MPRAWHLLASHLYRSAYWCRILPWNLSCEQYRFRCSISLGGFSSPILKRRIQTFPDPRVRTFILIIVLPEQNLFIFQACIWHWELRRSLRTRFRDLLQWTKQINRPGKVVRDQGQIWCLVDKQVSSGLKNCISTAECLTTLAAGLIHLSQTKPTLNLQPMPLDMVLCKSQIP